MLVNLNNASSDLTLAAILTPAGVLLGLLVILLALDGVYHIATRRRKNDQIKQLRGLLEGGHGLDVRVANKISDLENYTLMQIELGVLVHNSNEAKVISALSGNATVVHHAIIETYPAEGFVKIGGE